MIRCMFLAALALAPAALAAQQIPATPPANKPTPAQTAAQTAASAQAATPISLADAVRMAEQNAPQEIIARNQIRLSDVAVTSAYAAFIPTVNVSASTAYVPSATTRVDQASGQIVSGKWSGGTGLNLGVNLFDGGRRFYAISTARANVEAATASEVSSRFTVELNVQQAYYNALAARESEAAARTQLEQAQQQLAVSVSKVNAGVATRSDSLRSVIQVQNAQLALLTAQNNLENANATLTRLIASPTPVTAQPTDTLDVGPSLPDSVTLAKLAAGGPAVQQASAAYEAARVASKVARTPYLPSLDATYGWTSTGSDVQFSNQTLFNTYQRALRFTVSYPLFNQFQREQQRVTADITQANAEATLRDTRAQAQQLLVQNLSALRTADQQVSIQQATVLAAQEDLRVQQQRYQLGASTLLDVLTSQTTLNQAQAALIQARYNLRVAKAQIAALIGREF